MNKNRIAALLVLASFSLAACAPDNQESASSTTADSQQASTAESTAVSESAAPADITIAEGKDTAATPEAGTLFMRQMYTAPHGTKSFAAVNVIMNGDTIVSARLDEFQYLEPSDDLKAVPNADAGFGEAFPDNTILASKHENNDLYSTMMADHAGATQTWQASMDAITEFVKGKTAVELKEVVQTLEAQGENGNPADVVSGATFTDTRGYLQAIVDTAENGMISVGAQSAATELLEAQTLSAPHGDKSFAITTVALDGDKIAAVFLDEFQYVDAVAFGGVPNSDTDFGTGVKDGLVLASKVANNDAYSAMMAEKGGATQKYAENMKAVETFAIGKTIAEIESALAELEAQGEDGTPADVVSGATFSDTAGYLKTILEAAQQAQ